MTPHRADDEMPLDLPQLLPDRDRAERTRLRCRAVLARRHQRHVVAQGMIRRAVTSAAVGTLGLLYALYVADLVAKTLSFRNLPH